MYVCLLLIISNKLDLNQETRFTIVSPKLLDLTLMIMLVGARFFCLLVILPTSHSINRPFHQLTFSPCHAIHLPFHQLTICDNNLTCYQLSILSTWHFIIWHFINFTFYQFDILSTFHLIYFPFHQFDILLIWLFIKWAFHQLRF